MHTFFEKAVAGVHKRKIYCDLPSNGVILGGLYCRLGFHPRVQQEQGSPITAGDSFETLITQCHFTSQGMRCQIPWKVDVAHHHLLSPI